MNKYLLLSICYAFISPITQAQLIIGDLQIESTSKDNWIKITNISNKPIDKIIINGRIAPEKMRVLQPNKSLLFQNYTKTGKEEEEREKLNNLLKD